MAYIQHAIGIPIPAEQAEVYFDLLGDLPFEALMLSAKSVVLSHKFHTIPPVSELRDAALEIMRPLEDRITAGRAFEMARRAVRCFGYTDREQGMAQLPYLARNVMRQIGWNEFCDSENPEALRAHFFKLFEAEKAGLTRQAKLPANVSTAIDQFREIAKITASKMKGIE